MYASCCAQVGDNFCDPLCMTPECSMDSYDCDGLWGLVGGACTT